MSIKKVLKQFLKDVMHAQSCDPVLACFTHGRCWTHVMWRSPQDPIWKKKHPLDPDSV
jgi:hypothetical protein